MLSASSTVSSIDFPVKGSSVGPSPGTGVSPEGLCSFLRMDPVALETPLRATFRAGFLQTIPSQTSSEV